MQCLACFRLFRWLLLLLMALVTLMLRGTPQTWPRSHPCRLSQTRHQQQDCLQSQL
jgi:hypothetical protein